MAMTGFCTKSSILNRPKKTSAINRSNQDAEFAKEQAKLAAKKATRQNLADYRGAVLWGTADQKQQLVEQHKTQLNAHAVVKQNAAADVKAEQKYYSAAAAASEAQYAAAQEKRKAATKAYYQTLQHDNKQLASFRAVQKADEHAAGLLPPAPDNILNQFGRHAF